MLSHSLAGRTLCIASVTESIGDISQANCNTQCQIIVQVLNEVLVVVDTCLGKAGCSSVGYQRWLLNWYV